MRLLSPDQFLTELSRMYKSHREQTVFVWMKQCLTDPSRATPSAHGGSGGRKGRHRHKGATGAGGGGGGGGGGGSGDGAGGGAGAGSSGDRTVEACCLIRARVGHKLKISTLVGHRDLVKFHQGYSFVLKDCLDNLEHAKHKKGARRLRA